MNTNLNIAQDVIGQISFAIEQRPEAVAQLFADYGIKAPVNEGSILDALVVFKEPFLAELNAIIEGGEDSIFGGRNKNERKQKKEERKQDRQERKENGQPSRLGAVIRKIAPGGGKGGPNSSPAPPTMEETPLSPNPSPNGGGLSSKLNLSNVIDTAATVTQALKKVDKAIFDKKSQERGLKVVDENAVKTPFNNASNAPKEDKLFGLPKALAIGLIVVAILIVIFVIMRMRSK